MVLPTALARLTAAALLAAACAAATAQGAGAASASPKRSQVGSSLPDLGSSANAGLSRADEYQIGRMAMRDLRGENLVLEDPETTDYLQALGSRIGVEAQDGEQRLTFFAVRDPSLNAFALPGGFIGVNTGLILRTGNESELAAVMAHEIGHVVQRHMARALQAQSRNSLATIAGMLAGVLIGAVTGNVEASTGVIAMTQGAAMQQQINFTRMEEHEADRVGIGFLAAAGFDPTAMAGFFATMMRERGLAGDNIPPLLLTHPVDTVRIAEARARVGGLSHHERRPDAAGYPFVRERLRVIAGSGDADLRRYYEHALETDPKNPALRYGIALAELKSGSPRVAVELLEPLVAAQPLPLLQGALAQARIAAGDTEAGLATFERALKLAPRNVPLSVRYAEALTADGKAKQAHQLLLDLFNNVAPTPEQIRLIALVASAAGDIGDAYYYMAELHLSSGDLMLATTQLDLALATPGLTDVQRKRFQARRQEIQDYLREQGGRRGSRQPLSD